MPTSIVMKFDAAASRATRPLESQQAARPIQLGDLRV